jgi:RNA polymerase sigma-70 factor (ECF subfamily)
LSREAERFQALAMPHLDAAFNLARWLTGNDADAADVTQDALVRALRHIAGCRGDNPRAWLLAIVRRTAMTWLGRNRPRELVSLEQAEAADRLASDAPGPEALLIAEADRDLLDRLVADLPLPFREVVILREMEEMSYRDIAGITGLPVGTVMSRLARARAQLRRAWAEDRTRTSRHGV